MQERETDPSLNRQLAELRREALDVYDRIAPADHDAPALALERARIEMETGDPGRGLGRLNQLMNEHPKDQTLLNQIADLLTESDDRRAASLELECRKLQEAGLQQGTPAWLMARLDVIQALLRNSRTAEAKKLLTVTELVYRAPLAEPPFADRVKALKEKVTANQ
jgi:predicted Zn-dependent protease